MALSPQDSGSLSFPDRTIGRLARRLCIVARNHPLLFGYLSTLFRDRPAGSEQIELVIDRRHPEAPRTPPSGAPDVERRRPSEIDDELRRRGFAFVAEAGESFRPRDAARLERTVELLAGMEERSWPFRRRKRRPLLERIWGKRPGRTLAILGGIALVITMAAAEFRMNDLRERDLVSPSRLATRAAAPASRAERAPAAARSTPSAPVVSTPAPAAPAKPVATPPPTPVARAKPAPAAAAPLQPPAPASPPASQKTAQAAAKPAPVGEKSPAATPPAAPRPAASRVTAPDQAPRALAASTSSSPALVRTAAREPSPDASTAGPVATVAAATPAPASSDLRIELSRKPTSATGGGVVFLVRVTDLSGQPLSDAEVSMQAGRRPGGALFETRLYPAESPGTFRSGVIHPSTLPPDLTVRAVAGSRRVEALVER